MWSRLEVELPSACGSWFFSVPPSLCPGCLGRGYLCQAIHGHMVTIWLLRTRQHRHDPGQTCIPHTLTREWVIVASRWAGFWGPASPFAWLAGTLPAPQGLRRRLLPGSSPCSRSALPTPLSRYLLFPAPSMSLAALGSDCPAIYSSLGDTDYCCSTAFRLQENTEDNT